MYLETSDPKGTNRLVQWWFVSVASRRSIFLSRFEKVSAHGTVSLLPHLNL